MRIRSLRVMAAAGAALLAVFVFAQDQSPITVVVDGNPVQFAYQQPKMSNDRVLVPLRGVFEHLGASVDWNPADQSILARKEGIRVRLAIGQLDASVDGKPVHLDVAATLVNGTTMVPLRFVSEALGAYVTWNADAHEVDIRRSTNYNIPRSRVSAPAMIRRPLRTQGYAVVPAYTVLPFALDTRLSSVTARAGEPFSASLATNGAQQYAGLPVGTTAFGEVSYVRRQDSRHPGAIELTFQYLALPNGRHLPLVGKLISLDAGSVEHVSGNRIVARSHSRHDHVMYTGYGGGPGVVISYRGPESAAEIDLNRELAARFGAHPRETNFREVELPTGTQVGLLLYQDMEVPVR